MNKSNIINLLTFDIEDWFHILDLPGTNSADQWKELESRVKKNTNKILDLLDQYQTKATFFILGWIAERHPDLVLEIYKKGHEVASHGYGHQMVTSLSKNEFRQDLLKSREILKNITGEYPVSYRCPGFSITRENDWALEEIAKCGFLYDASIYPGKHGHGGHPLFDSKIVKVQFKATKNELVEFPVSVASILGKEMCFSGGGYLRLLPLFLIQRKFNEFATADKSVVTYLHPREFDPNGPKLDMPLKRKFRSYVNVNSAEKKMICLLQKYNFTSLRHYFIRFSSKRYRTFII
ncbi:XrtA system polysaccharide deacetylase [uncultured Desulfobacter sp.]|uniref:XrtA system polysaccharide deacetylase n=1 Tax=uncultured Desulfobacter sp. TaxID=240139 RepID=UPI002AA6D005|nr:XrtA system polysaccharide deacetylase [uncultured Desulfobacter sp.]